MLTRRTFTLAGTAGLLGAPLLLPGRATAAAGWEEGLAATFRKLESGVAGRLGVAVLDTASGRRALHRADERFPMCSTFKLLAAAAVLARVDRGEESLDRRIPIAAADILSYAPVTKERVGGEGMTLAELCDAAVTRSDNTAANLLLASLGGPAGLTAFARSIGDRLTRLDRTEPTANEATPGDPRDTTTPAAMAETVRALVLGDRLSAESRGRLTGWLVANTTGDETLRAGVPGWRVGDKTGSGPNGTRNDVGVLWPPGRAPLVVSVYITGSTASADARNRTIAEVARAVAAATPA